MRPGPAIILMLILPFAVAAQTNVSKKLGASLKLFLNSEKTDQRFITIKNGQTHAALFIEYDDKFNLPEKFGSIRTRVGNIATADIPLHKIMELAALPGIKKLELPLLFAKTDSLSKKLVGADKVLAGVAPLNQPYTGKNCVIGIIDDGIDITHPDFFDSAGNTRIHSIWNMDLGGVPPDGYFYGKEWLHDSIVPYVQQFKAKQKTGFEMQNLFGFGGHGTPVTGLAAGKNGIAPGAVIVSVALTATLDTLLRSDRIIDGIAYIYAKAKALNKKCIVNISLGVQDGAPHDGKSVLERAIDEFCKDKSDILIAVSAGNNGNSWKHWAALPVHKDSSFGFFRCAYEGKMYFIVPRKDSDSLTISIGESKLGDLNAPWIHKDSVIYQTPFVRLSDLIGQTTPLEFKSYQKNGATSSIISFTAAHANEDYDEVIVKVQEFTSGTNGVIFDDHLYRYIFKGTGTVHGWYPFWNLHPIYFFGNNPYPDDPTYISTDNAYSTNIPSNAFTVISSGAFNARECYLRRVNNDVVRTYPMCQLTYFTSHGPTLDGRIKPDIIAPGENVFAPRSQMDLFLEHYFIIDTTLQAFSGTSASSPITAGVAAMLWEYNPEFLRSDIIERIKSTAYGDSHTQVTGDLPNNVSGWGKIDAFKALTGQSANATDNCLIQVICEAEEIIPDTPPDYSTVFSLYPNPAYNFVTLEYRSLLPSQVVIYNSSGQQMSVFNLPPTQTILFHQLPVKRFSPGIYFVRIINKEKSLTKKLLIRQF